MLNMEFLNYMKKKIVKGVLHVFWFFPIDKKKITLLNELSYTYGDSMKYLDLYIRQNRAGQYMIVFPIKEGAIPPNNGEIIVRPNTLNYFYQVLTSGTIITNAGGVSFLPKRKGQKIISTWHGGGPYKKTSTDVYDNYWYRKEVMMNSDNTDFILSSCKYFTEMEAKSMGYSSDKCIPAGLPRNDILFEKHDEIKRKVREFYSIPNDKKFILYAPTFRSSSDESTSKMISNYIDIDIDMVVRTLEKKFACKWAMGIRLHPKLKEVEMNGINAINCTSYPDMQELLYCADAIISDYSSLIWDYSLTFKPCFLYAPDIEEYERERGFYMPVAKWPYPIAHDNEELINNILKFNYDEYKKKVLIHHNESGSYENGNACEILLQLIETGI